MILMLNRLNFVFEHSVNEYFMISTLKFRIKLIMEEKESVHFDVLFFNLIQQIYSISKSIN